MRFVYFSWTMGIISDTIYINIYYRHKEKHMQVAHMKKKGTLYVICCSITLTVLFITGGCKQKDRTAHITFNVEDQEFSDAEISIDGVSVGRMEQTLIKPNGELYINGQFTANLPPKSPEIGKEDIYSGVLDSIRLKSGKHTIAIVSQKGKQLQIEADVSPGYHLLTLFPAEGTIKWDKETIKAVPGTTIAIKNKTK